MSEQQARKVARDARRIAWDRQAALLEKASRRVPFLFFFTVTERKTAAERWQDAYELGTIDVLCIMARRLDEAFDTILEENA